VADELALQPVMSFSSVPTAHAYGRGFELRTFAASQSPGEPRIARDLANAHEPRQHHRGCVACVEIDGGGLLDWVAVYRPPASRSQLNGQAGTEIRRPVLKEVAIGTSAITIGQSPDSDIYIDNLAVSTHHAAFSRWRTARGRRPASVNGIFIDNSRVKKGPSVLRHHCRRQAHHRSRREARCGHIHRTRRSLPQGRRNVCLGLPSAPITCSPVNRGRISR
jgi:hypothetical protein